MKTKKMKIKEIKPKMKIIGEVKSEKSSTLEETVNIDSDEPMVSSSSSSSVNPTLTQKFEQQEQRFSASKQQERRQTESITYQALNQQTSTRSYNPTIQGQSQLTASQAASSERIDPTLPQAGGVRGVGGGQSSGDLRESLNQSGIEPAMRRFNQDEERDYNAERSVEKYLAKRKTNMM